MNLIATLQSIIDPACLFLSNSQKAYAQCDQSTNVAPSMPLIVVKVSTRLEFIKVVEACLNEKVPIVMRGAGTGKSGGAVAPPHAVVIDCSEFNRILAIDCENLTATVEPGVILGDLQQAVRAKNLFYPPDPASWKWCTLGGNVAENAAGPSTLKYGSTRDYLLGGEAILGTGELIRFGKNCPKGVTGFDISSLFCGSEGTLALFTEFTLRLLPLPKDESAALFLFKDNHSALKAVTKILHNGHLPKTLEYIDITCLNALKKQGHLQELAPNLAALLIECDASFIGGAYPQIKVISETLDDKLEVIMATHPENKKRFWEARIHLSDACTNYLGFKISEDMAIPLATLANFAEWFSKQATKNLSLGLFGHAGDGNLHVQIMFSDEKHQEEAHNLRHKLLLKVLSLGGTLSAEHGIGLQKKSYLSLEQSEQLINLQKRIKYACDPYNLLNPGKIFD